MSAALLHIPERFRLTVDGDVKTENEIWVRQAGVHEIKPWFGGMLVTMRNSQTHFIPAEYVDYVRGQITPKRKRSKRRVH